METNISATNMKYDKSIDYPTKKTSKVSKVDKVWNTKNTFLKPGYRKIISSEDSSKQN